METANGWEIVRRLVMPDEVFGSYLFSPEFLETSDGKLYLMGISAELPTTTDLTAIVIYDLEADTWSQITDQQFAFDPEIVELENGNFALYYRNTVTPSTDWIVVTGEEVLEAAVPGVVTPLPDARAAGGESKFAPFSASLADDTTGIAPIGLATISTREPSASRDRIAEEMIAVSEADDGILALLDWASSDDFEFTLPRVSDRSAGAGSAVLAADLSALTSGLGRGL